MHDDNDDDDGADDANDIMPLNYNNPNSGNRAQVMRGEVRVRIPIALLYVDCQRPRQRRR